VGGECIKAREIAPTAPEMAPTKMTAIGGGSTSLYGKFTLKDDVPKEKAMKRKATSKDEGPPAKKLYALHKILFEEVDNMLEKYPMELEGDFPKDNALWKLRKPKTHWYYDLCSLCRKNLSNENPDLEMQPEGFYKLRIPMCVACAMKNMCMIGCTMHKPTVNLTAAVDVDQRIITADCKGVVINGCPDCLQLNYNSRAVNKCEKEGKTEYMNEASKVIVPLLLCVRCVIENGMKTQLQKSEKGFTEYVYAYYLNNDGEKVYVENPVSHRTLDIY
jgi:hypothetical protein